MKRVLKKLAHIGLIVITLFVVLSIVPNAAHAEDDEDITLPISLDSYPKKTKDVNFVYFGFEKEKLSTLLPTTIHEPADPGQREDYEAVYEDALNYFGQDITVKLEISFLGGNDYGYNNTETTGIWHTEETGSRQRYSVWLKAFGADFKVKVSFYEDKNCTTPFQFTGAISFIDPDQSNYIFDVYNAEATGHEYREFYYRNTDNLGQKYTVTSGGLNRNSWGNIADDELGVALYGESSFEFTINGYGDWIYLPDFVVVEAPYRIEYYYEKNGVYDEQNPDDSGTRTANIYKNPKLKVVDSDKDPDLHQHTGDGNYALDESKNSDWEVEWPVIVDAYGQTVLNEDVTPVLKVYFKEQYRVTYHDDLDQTVFDDTGRSNYDYGDETDGYTPTAAPKGYEFVGWRDPDDDKVYKPEQIEGREVTKDKDYYAVWKALPYVIKYMPNYDDFSGEYMPDNTYYIYSPSMESTDNWTYTRDGYAFIGYSIEDKDGKLVPVDSDDFVHDFIDTLPDEGDRTIILYAQWTPVYTIKYRPNYEGFSGEYMKDDTYYGTSETMNSKEQWTYTRNGYKFLGYSVEDENGDLIPVNDPDFAHDFIDMLPYEDDRVIILYAQWEKLPIIPYVLPVTGVDR